MEKSLIVDNYNKPKKCNKCGSGNIEYKGVGEYRCSDCGEVLYDDYGLVRKYIEENRGATQSEVAKGTGVSTARIRQMLKDDRIEIAPGSLMFLNCEKCGANIRSGRYCESCQTAIAMEAKNNTHKSVVKGGFTKSALDKKGAIRFGR